MRSPPALRELNVGADRRAQLILRIMRISLYMRYTVHGVHGILYYTFLKNDCIHY